MNKQTRTKRRAWSTLLLASAFLLAQCGGGEDLPDGTPPPGGDDVIALQRVFPDLSFDAPLFVSAAPGDSKKLFVVEKGGRIYVFDRSAGSPNKHLFLDIGAKIETDGEQGLLGLAFDPDYAGNGRFYVYYSASRGTAGLARSTVVARYTRRTDNASEADPTSELKLLTIEQAQANSNHNGGWIGVGVDGQLYVAVGDGGGSGDPGNNAQNLNSLLGKILRIGRDGSIPADNPFAGQAGRRGEIWAYGLRNPFRASFDSGTLWIGDVGQSQIEEIDLGAKGANYGWRKYEGTQVYNNSDPTPSGVTMPVFQYDHSNGRCSIIGGYVYRGSAINGPVGTYFFADYCSKEVWQLSSDHRAADTVGILPTQPTSFGTDSDGELYLTGSDGALYKLVPR
jgi:glucose/arabinose dehydrogenase